MPADKIALLTEWVKMGAPWPEAKVAAAVSGEWRPTEAQRQWWAYQPLRPKSPPLIKSAPNATG